MAADSRKKLRRVTVLFWILLFYIVAALIWWLVSLEQQNRMIHELKAAYVLTQDDPIKRLEGLEAVTRSERRESIKYLAEGVTFLLLILFGAAYIYRLVRRQFRLQQQQQNFVMAVTHELKTPLSVARLNLETMQKHQLDEGKRKQMLQTSLEETMRLDTLINNILISSELDSEAYPVSKEHLNFSKLVEDAVNEFRHRHEATELRSMIDEEVNLNGDPLLLKLLISNLLENARKYSEKDRPIICQLRSSPIKLCIMDQGIGIPDEEKKMVFEKFYRVGNEKTRRAKGTGLGLYICKKIADAHGAKIVVTDNQPAGTNFTVNFTR